jgi:hypothetical protein
MMICWLSAPVYASIDAIDAALILAVELSLAQLPDLVGPERVVSPVF